jgi:Ca-activated chloride channel family protein
MMPPLRRALALLPAVAAWLAAASLAAPVFEVGLVEPLAGQPAFGATQVAAEVRGGEAARVEFYFDGGLVGTLERPPWRLTVDVGQENAERRFRVVAIAADGTRDDAELVLPAIRVDDSIEVPLQQLYVTATRGGDPALDLGREDFQVSDDGNEQKLVTFERGDVPLTAVLVVDSSLSMRGAPLAAALAGARAFAAGMAPLDESMLLAVSDRVLRKTAFTADPAELVAGVTGASARGGSAIFDHLYLALLELERRQGRKVVVLLSDGIDVDSLLSSRELEGVVGRSQALLYWIRLRSAERGARHRSAWRDFDEHAAELEGLERLVERSGGRIVELPRIADAESAFRSVLDELRRQYVLGYYPSASRHDGSWRKIRVDVAQGAVALRAREGYYDD